MAKTLIAYETGKALSGASLRDRLIAESRKHREQDRYIKGTYYRNGTADWKGCAVGCSLRTLTDLKLYNPRKKNAATLGDHVQFERIGIPVALAQLQDTIFEGLPAGDREKWPQQFFTAIQPGADLSMVATRFMLRILTDKQHGTINRCDEAGKAATLQVAKLLRTRLRGVEPTTQEWSAAWAAAWAAASAAAWAAAEDDHYQWMRDVLLKLMRNAPMAEEI